MFTEYTMGKTGESRLQEEQEILGTAEGFQESGGSRVKRPIIHQLNQFILEVSREDAGSEDAGGAVKLQGRAG